MNRNMPDSPSRKTVALSSWSLPTVLLLVLACLSIEPTTTGTLQVTGDSCFPTELDLSSLNGTDGFAINGEAGGDASGWSVSYAGDVNGDNVNDIIIGAHRAEPNGLNSGKSYVVFGKNTSESTNFPSELELSSLDGTNGFAINGEDSSDSSGQSVSHAGDLNGDNIGDIIIGARNADPNGISNAGKTYVVFGRNTAESTSFPAELELSSLDGTNGFAIHGEVESDNSGYSVSYAGDVNGDSIDDIIIGATGADPNGINNAGTSYVVFGKNTAESTSFPSELELSTLDGSNGFAINGEAKGDNSGFSVSYAGDVNGDNVDDIIIGAPDAAPNGIGQAGKSYVVFGRNTAESTSFPSELELSSLDGTNGFAIHGEAEVDYSGYSVSYAGDVNGDNVDDIVISAWRADANGITQAGISYVVFGRNTAESTSFPSELEVSSLDGTNGFAIKGEAEDDYSGGSVSYAGDLNYDAIDDTIIGAPVADPNGISGAGKTYVVFGKNTSESTEFPSEMELSSLNGTNGFVINGEAEGDKSGQSVSNAGDVNGDNIDDIIIGAQRADPNGKSNAGTSYVVFGIDCTPSTNSPTSIPAPSPTTAQPTRSPANKPAAQTAILSLLFETPFVKETHDTRAFKDAICEVVSTVTGLQCGENLEVLSVQGTTSSEGEEALLISFEIPKGSIDVDELGELAAEINSEISSSDDEDVQNLPPIDEISYDVGSSSSSMSTEAIVGIAIGSVIAMAALFAVGYKTLYHPHSRKPGKVYAVFLTHHKQDGGEAARAVKGELERRFKKKQMKPYKCFLDVDEYLDLNNLREEVEKSEVLCVLQTKEVNTRPWCLLELGTAIDNNIPIVALNLQGKGYEFPAQEKALGNLRETLETRNPGAVEVLEKCGIDVDELGNKLAHHIPKIISLPFDPVFWSEKPQAATFDTLVERIQQAKRKSVASLRAKKNDEVHMSPNVDAETGNSTAS